MDNFGLIYKILSELEKDMDLSQPNLGALSAEALNITQKRWEKYLEMLSDAGLVKNVSITEYRGGNRRIDISRITITLKGLEYLSENSIMQRICKRVRGVEEIIPGI